MNKEILKDLLTSYIEERNKNKDLDYKEFAHNFSTNYKIRQVEDRIYDNFKVFEIEDYITSLKAETLVKQGYYCLSQRMIKPAENSKSAIKYAVEMLYTLLPDGFEKYPFALEEKYLYSLVTDEKRYGRSTVLILEKLLGIGCGSPFSKNEIAKQLGVAPAKINDLVSDCIDDMHSILRNMVLEDYKKEKQADVLLERMIVLGASDEEIKAIK